jgi:hypothetical protein
MKTVFFYMLFSIIAYMNFGLVFGIMMSLSWYLTKWGKTMWVDGHWWRNIRVAIFLWPLLLVMLLISVYLDAKKDPFPS